MSERGERIPAPPGEEGRRWREDMAILEADPRTSGSANRPPWLVKRVLDEHAARKARARGKVVLVVDDDPDAREVLRLVLESEGYRVTEATTVEEAVLCHQNDPCDVLISDWTLRAGQTGKNVLEALEPIPGATILVSGREDVDEDVFDVSIRKPIRMDRLVETVKAPPRRRRY